MPSLLLTGFEPFGGSSVNPSAEVVRRLATESFTNLRLHTHILPVDVERAPRQLRDALASLRPDWCVMLGQAEGRAALSIERVAVNLCDFNIPDNTGNQLVDEPIDPHGPAAYFATLPVRALLESLAGADVPAELSLTAGAYLCNLVFYTALHTCHTTGLPTRCGFIHMPALPSQMSRERHPRPSMGLDIICTGLRAILQTLAREPIISSAG